MKTLDGIAFAASLVLTILLTFLVLASCPRVTQVLYGEPQVILCVPNVDDTGMQ